MASIDRSSFTVALDGDFSAVSDGLRATASLLRRRDRSAGVLALAGRRPTARCSSRRTRDLKDGVQVYCERVALFRRPYRRGDCWLIPARTDTGDVLWPPDADGKPQSMSNGIVNHYAPLVWITAADATKGT
ncbi:MAG: DUF6519 domain-containing protein [Solirubrobacteraceae bacterium]